jgi:hypothetical protein
MPRGQDEYDPRIVLAPGYRAPQPQGHGKRHRWPKRILRWLLTIAVLAAAAVFGGEWWLARDPRLPRFERLSDYRPLQLTRIRASSGELIGEIGSERRTVVALDQVPAEVRRALVQRFEPGFFDRPSLGRLDALKAVLARLRGRPELPSLTLSLARAFTDDLPDRGMIRFLREWTLALRLERKLSKNDLLALFSNQARFGAGRFGVDEGARGLFDLPLAKLDAKQSGELARWAGSSTTPPHAVKPSLLAPDCAAEAERELAARYDAPALARLGTEVATPCEIDLTRTISDAIHKRGLDKKDGPRATVVVLSVPGQETRALVGGDGRLTVARPIGAARAPVVLAAALRSLKWTVLSPFGHDQTDASRPAADPRPDPHAPLDLNALPLRHGRPAVPPADTRAPHGDGPGAPDSHADARPDPVASALGSAGAGARPGTAGSPAGTVGHGRVETLKALAQRDPAAAADALISAGLSPAAVREVALDLGLAGDLVNGKMLVKPLELASVLATLGAGGARRIPLLLERVGTSQASAESRAAMQAISPELAWLTSSLLPLRGRTPRPANGLSFTDGGDAWFAAYTPEVAVVVRVAYDDGKPLPAGVDAAPLGADVLTAALRNQPAHGWPAPAKLVARGGELFLDGSLPKERR